VTDPPNVHILGSRLGVVTAGNPGPLTLEGTRTYVLGESRLVIVDPGPDDSGHLGRVVDLVAGRPVEAICLTHAHSDHAAGAETVSDVLRAPIAASARTLHRADLSGRVLDDGDALPIDDGVTSLQAIVTPGHTSDDLCFLWLPSRDLLTGDLVLGRGTSVSVYRDGQVGHYLASLSRLAALRPTRILPGHGELVNDPAAKLEAYRKHRLRRDRQVLGAVRDDGCRSVTEIRRRVYGELPDGVVRAADSSILAHLEHLEQLGHELPPIALT
jgi:glyoxylase-like metal-dependent hydrolase (beta-lactamase superfamily II)